MRTEKGLAQTRQMYVLRRQTNQRIEGILGKGATEQLRLLSNRVASPDFLAAVIDGKQAE